MASNSPDEDNKKVAVKRTKFELHHDKDDEEEEVHDNDEEIERKDYEEMERIEQEQQERQRMELEHLDMLMLRAEQQQLDEEEQDQEGQQRKHLSQPDLGRMNQELPWGHPDLARMFQEFARDQPDLARMLQEFASEHPDLSSMSLGSMRMYQEFAREHPAIARMSLESAKKNPDLARLFRELLREQPDLASIYQEMTREHPDLERIGMESARKRPDMTRQFFKFLKKQPQLANLGIFEFDRRAFTVEKSLKNGRVRLYLTKCLCQGPPRVGKTLLKCLLLSIAVESSASTRCAERSIRAVCSGRYRQIDGEKWELMDETLLMNMIASEMKYLDKENEEPDLVVDDTTISELITLVGESESISHSQQKWIYFIDSGGQPQFHEVLQAFIPDTSVILQVFKLTEKLSDSPSMDFETSDGRQLSLGVHALSNQEILKRQARILHCTPDAKMQIALVGTYYDKYQEALKISQIEEKIEDKEINLVEVFSGSKKQVIFRDSSFKQCIYPVNGLQAVEGKFDDPVICELRKCIASSISEEVDIPIRWHVLELALQKESQALNRCVFSFAEVNEIAQRYQFENEDEVIDALTFLAKYNLILYYPNLLPDVIFTTPQVLLDKVTELTEKMYPPHRGEYEEMVKKGIVSLQILKDFPKHYRRGVFTETEVVNIFEFLYICSKLDEEKFFMPALLLPLTHDNLNKISLSSPLLYHFQEGCVPAGLFCALVVLLSNKGYKVLVDDPDLPLKTPHNNAVMFEIPRMRRIAITIIDSFYRLEVHYHSAAGVDDLRKYLPEIQETLEDSLKEVIKNRKYKINIPEQAFFCRGDKCRQPTNKSHVAIVDEKGELTCSIRPHVVFYAPSEDESLWLGPYPASSNELTTIQLFEELIETSHKWFEIGIYLEVPDYRLQYFRTRNCDVIQQLYDVLDFWKNNPKPTKPYTWQTIVSCLRSRTVSDERLASEIEQRYL